ncbi:hypothetical protein SESBI_50760 [Sesbania bispinosa]|nr:hypothetical protein SESBI_50760 [Sesbania bispinosa]
MLASALLTPSNLNPSHFLPPTTRVSEFLPRSRVAFSSKSNTKISLVVRLSTNGHDGAVDATSLQLLEE